MQSNEVNECLYWAAAKKRYIVTLAVHRPELNKAKTKGKAAERPQKDKTGMGGKGRVSRSDKTGT